MSETTAMNEAPTLVREAGDLSVFRHGDDVIIRRGRFRPGETVLLGVDQIDGLVDGLLAAKPRRNALPRLNHLSVPVKTSRPSALWFFVGAGALALISAGVIGLTWAAMQVVAG
jgi:hypothetical protein